jgi:hypothetical protein
MLHIKANKAPHPEHSPQLLLSGTLVMIQGTLVMTQGTLVMIQ